MGRETETREIESDIWRGGYSIRPKSIEPVPQRPDEVKKNVDSEGDRSEQSANSRNPCEW